MPFTQTEFIQGPVTPGGVTLDLSGSDLGAGSVGTAELANGAVTTAILAANAVTAPKLNYFVAHGQTGTGSSQSIAHGLGVTPAFALVIFEGSTASQAVTYGSNTSTNVVVTVTTGAAFTVFALA